MVYDAATWMDWGVRALNAVGLAWYVQASMVAALLAYLVWFFTLRQGAD